MRFIGYNTRYRSKHRNITTREGLKTFVVKDSKMGGGGGVDFKNPLV